MHHERTRQATRRLTIIYAVAALCVFGGCASDDPGITPERSTFYFPTSLLLDTWRDPATRVADPSRPLLFVGNANADLRFNGGTITVADLSALGPDLSLLGQRVEKGQVDCAPDRTDSSRWECAEKQFIDGNATVRIGDFPGDLQLGDRAAYDETRLFAPIRGQNHLLWLDVVNLPEGRVDLRCNDDPETGCDSGASTNCEQWDCDDRHQVSRSERLGVDIPEEPFGLYLNRMTAVFFQEDGSRRTCLDGLVPTLPCECSDDDACDCRGESKCEGGEANKPACCTPRTFGCCAAGTPVDHAYVTHLDDGEISLFVSDADGVRLEDIQRDFFGDAEAGFGGAFGVAASVPGDSLSPTYVSSRLSADLAAFVVRDDRQIIRTRGFTVSAVSPPATLRADFRGVAVSPGGERVYAASRAPNALAAMDPIDDQGTGGSRPLWAVAVCDEPSAVVLGPQVGSDDPQDQLAYVVCFAESEIMIVDTRLSELVGRMRTGRGPNALVLDVGSKSSCSDEAGCASPFEQCNRGRCLKKYPRAFVANFLENTIGVINLDPTSRDFRRMVVRLGLRRRLVED